MSKLQIRLIGRLGNCVGQYAFARSFAETHGMELEWWQNEGTPLEEIFEGIEARRPVEKCPGWKFDTIPTKPFRDVGYCIEGYYQYDRAFEYMSLRQLREWFTFRQPFRVHRPDRFYVAAHVRAGDYLHHPTKFASVTRSAFVQAIMDAGYDMDDVIWFTEEEPHEYPGIPSQYNHLVDFQLIQQADVIFRSNSTFSQWAAFLSTHALTTGNVYAPEVGERVGPLSDVKFVRGNHPALICPKLHNNCPHTEARIEP